MNAGVQIHAYGSPALPILIYMPGLHGDWTLVSGFRRAVSGRVRFIQVSYPRTTNWSVEDYARNVEATLLANGVSDGWLVAESFSSLTAWKMIEHVHAGDTPFQVRGLVLAGGFVRHPWPWGAKLLSALSAHAPRWFIRAVLDVYRAYARFRHGRAPETETSLREFVANRLHPDDRPAMTHRYSLVIRDDPRTVARATSLPVYCLAGLADPVVPYPLVRRWLKQHCPGYRGSALIWSADHHVLGTAPERSSEMIFGWMTAEHSQSCFAVAAA